MEKVFKRKILRKRAQKDILELIFEAAKQGGVQYLFSLLRLEGWTNYTEDAIEVLHSKIVTFLNTKNPNKSELQIIVEVLKNEYGLYSLIANLIRNSNGDAYIFTPLPKQIGEMGVGFNSPENLEHIAKLAEMLEGHLGKAGESSLSNIPLQLKKFVYQASKQNVSQRLLTLATKNICSFLNNFILTYQCVLLNFKDDPLIYRLPANSLMIMELLRGEKGLTGFKVHHREGAISHFERKETRTEQSNYMLENKGVVLFVGMQNNNEPLYRFNGEPAYLKGIPGKYNRLGEWKPIVYPDQTWKVEQIVRELVGDEKDKRVEGCLFYIVSTCHHRIEFIVKTKFTLPFETNTIRGDFGVLHMQKIQLRDTDGARDDLQVYDCTLGLNEVSGKSVKKGIDAIETIVSRLTFRVDNSATWFLKYPSFMSSKNTLNLSKKDIPLIDDYLVNFDTNDALKFDTAISWYLNGKNSTNVFTQYLSFYIALESLAISFAAGELNVCKRYRVTKKTKAEKRKMRLTCIQELHEKLYDTHPDKFVTGSYSECIRSLKKQTLFSLTRVFGKKNKIVSDFFEKKGGYSLYDLRNQLAHGSMSHIDAEHADLITERLGEIKRISYEFILRLSSKTANKKRLRKVNSYSATISMSDPRSCHVTSSLEMLPRKDWTIIPEWID